MTRQARTGPTRRSRRRPWAAASIAGKGDHAHALQALIAAGEKAIEGHTLSAAGHRIVHGGTEFAEPVLLTADTMAKLKRLSPLAPLHQPYNLAAVDSIAEWQQRMPQIGCFDTAFHRTQPRLATLFALPRVLSEEGIRRYGFHGLSYEYIAGVLPEHLGPLADGKVVVAHLGHGASMCAMLGRKNVATTMGFTALDGLMMGRRCGAIDPGVILYMMQEKQMTPDAVSDLLYERPGLAGVSGVSDDMRELLSSEDPHAREAVELFVYRAVRELGSLASAVGGNRRIGLHRRDWRACGRDPPAHLRGRRLARRGSRCRSQRTRRSGDRLEGEQARDSGHPDRRRSDDSTTHPRDPPRSHPQTQGKIERWHQTLKNRILLDNYYLPSDLERQINAFVEHYNHFRYHESIDNLTPADVYFGRTETILAERKRVKLATIANRPAGSTAGRLNSNPDEPEPPFASHLISFKLSDDGHFDQPQYIEAAIRSQRHSSGIFSSSRNPSTHPIETMRHEHDEHGAELAKLSTLTADMTAPEDACRSWRALYAGLANFADDLVVHVHIENNKLFPRFER